MPGTSWGFPPSPSATTERYLAAVFGWGFSYPALRRFSDCLDNNPQGLGRPDKKKKGEVARAQYIAHEVPHCLLSWKFSCCIRKICSATVVTVRNKTEIIQDLGFSWCGLHRGRRAFCWRCLLLSQSCITSPSISKSPSHRASKSQGKFEFSFL